MRRTFVARNLIGWRRIYSCSTVSPRYLDSGHRVLGSCCFLLLLLLRILSRVQHIGSPTSKLTQLWLRDIAWKLNRNVVPC
jgi:hypothetical protein